MSEPSEVDPNASPIKKGYDAIAEPDFTEFDKKRKAALAEKKKLKTPQKSEDSLMADTESKIQEEATAGTGFDNFYKDLVKESVNSSSRGSKAGSNKKRGGGAIATKINNTGNRERYGANDKIAVN